MEDLPYLETPPPLPQLGAQDAPGTTQQEWTVPARELEMPMVRYWRPYGIKGKISPFRKGKVVLSEDGVQLLGKQTLDNKVTMALILIPLFLMFVGMGMMFVNTYSRTYSASNLSFWLYLMLGSEFLLIGSSVYVSLARRPADLPIPWKDVKEVRVDAKLKWICLSYRVHEKKERWFFLSFPVGTINPLTGILPDTHRCSAFRNAVYQLAPDVLHEDTRNGRPPVHLQIIYGVIAVAVIAAFVALLIFLGG